MDSPMGQPGSGSRPVLSFHLGLALLLAAVFTLTGIFSCCYHWDRIRRSFSPRAADDAKSGIKEESLLPVIMPGDQVPKFIAMTCPLAPPRQDGGVVEEVKTAPLPAKPGVAPFYAFVIPY